MVSHFGHMQDIDILPKKTLLFEMLGNQYHKSSAQLMFQAMLYRWVGFAFLSLARTLAASSARARRGAR